MRILLATLLWVAASCQAQESALLELQDRLGVIKSLSGGFQQKLHTIDGELLEHSSGQFALLQPGYFSWQIQLPDEQLLLAANGVLWHYDVELETVTQRQIPEGNPYSPLEILAGDSELLAQQYRVEGLGKDSWRLLPVFGTSDFVAITLTFDGALPQSMDVLDPLDRTTHIEFTGLLLNPALSDADFEFNPPAGVDVYQHD